MSGVFLSLLLCLVCGLVFTMSLLDLLGAKNIDNPSSSINSSNSSDENTAATQQQPPFSKELMIMSYINIVVFGIGLVISLGFFAKTFLGEVVPYVNKVAMDGGNVYDGALFVSIFVIATVALSYGVIGLQYNQETSANDDSKSPSPSSMNTAFINSIVFICLGGLLIVAQMIVGLLLLYRSSVKTEVRASYSI